MNIAFFHATLPEPGRKVGGVEVFVHRLATQLVDRGHKVTIFTFTNPPKGANYQVRQLRPRAFSQSKIARTLAVPLLLNSIDFSEFDVLHLHGDDWFYLWRRVPTIRTFHGSALFEAINSDKWPRRLHQSVIYPLELLASRLAKASYAVADQGMYLYRLTGILPCGVEVRGGEPLPKSENPSVLFVGTWLGRKRGAYLEQQFRQHVLPAVPNAELWMVSDFCEESDQVKCIRFPDDGQLVSLYQQAWVFCLPSTYEGFGIPYIEAMANGTAVVATPNPGARFVLREGRSGIIVNSRDLGNTLAQTLNDDRLRVSLAEAGRERAEAFSWQHIIQMHEAAYAALVARDSGS